MNYIILFSVFAIDTSLPPSSPVMSCDHEAIFICQSDPLECISKTSKCDGIPECSNGHDEGVQTCGMLLIFFNLAPWVDLGKRITRLHLINSKKREIKGLDCEQ